MATGRRGFSIRGKVLKKTFRNMLCGIAGEPLAPRGLCILRSFAFICVHLRSFIFIHSSFLYTYVHTCPFMVTWGSGILDPAPRIWDPGSGIQYPGLMIQNPQDPGSRKSRIQDPGSGIQDPGSGILDHPKILDPGSWIPDPASRIEDPVHWILQPGSRSSLHSFYHLDGMVGRLQGCFG